MTQPGDQGGRASEAPEIVGGFDQRQIAALFSISAHATIVQSISLDSFGQHDHHSPADPLREKAIALG